MKKILTTLLLLLALPTYAADYIHAGGVSFHFQDTSNYNALNYGIGIEHEYNKNLSYALGWYRNSIEKDSAYIFIRVTPDREHILGGNVLNGKVNYMIGGVSGYKNKAVPMVLPSICWTNVCTFFIPKFTNINETSVVGLNFRFKI